MPSITLEAPAKINLFLRVLAREESGYHGIETLFCRISLADTLAVARADGRTVTLTSEGEECGPPAGLGGGSSDAAAALDGVNQLLGNPIPRHELLQLASKLGADVPFFLSGA